MPGTTTCGFMPRAADNDSGEGIDLAARIEQLVGEIEALKWERREDPVWAAHVTLAALSYRKRRPAAPPQAQAA